MLNITKTENGKSLEVALEGRLDTNTSPQLNEALADLDGITSLKFDFEKLEYISSSGLRELLSAQKRMNKQGTMTIKNVCEDIMEVFDITGFSDILSIE